MHNKFVYIEIVRFIITDDIFCRNHPVLQRGISLPESSSHSSTVIESNSSNHITIVEVESQSAPQPEVFNFENLTSALETNTVRETPSEVRNVHYERLYQLQSPGKQAFAIHIFSFSNRVYLLTLVIAKK